MTGTPPVREKTTAADDTLTALNAALDASTAVRADALRLVADNPWCVTALGRRGIDVTP